MATLLQTSFFLMLRDTPTWRTWRRELGFLDDPSVTRCEKDGFVVIFSGR